MAKKKKVLTIDDVVSIKRHLLFKELNGKEIAKKFDVTATTISRIKLGQQFAEVVLDENGDYIDEKMNDKEFKDILYRHENRTKNQKLNKFDVIDIKYILLKGYLSNEEIAELFRTNSRNIRNIKNGIVWGDVILDEDGNYTPPTVFSDEPVDEYIVPYIPKVVEEEKKIEVVLSDEEQRIMDIKKQFIEDLWELKPIWIRNGSGKYRSTKIVSANIKFNIWLHAHWSKKYKPYRRISLQDFMAQAALIIQESVIRFAPSQKDFDWDNVKIVEEDEEGNPKDKNFNLSSLNIIFDYLKKAINLEMKEYGLFKQNGKKFAYTVDGERHYEYVTIGASSIDVVVKGEEGEINTVLSTLDGDSAIFGQRFECEFDKALSKIDEDKNDEIGSMSHFVKFFQDNKRYFLNEEEYQSWEIIRSTQHIRGGGGYTVNDRHLYGLSKNKAKNIRRPIKAKAIAAYQEKYPDLHDKDEYLVKPRQYYQIQLLKEFLAIVDNDEIKNEDVNKYLSQFITSRLNIVPFIYDYAKESLDGFDFMDVIDTSKKELSSTIIYKLVDAAESKIEALEMESESYGFYRKEDEYIQFGKVVSIDEYRKTQGKRHPERKKRKKRKKHTAKRLSAYGTEFDLHGDYQK